MKVKPTTPEVFRLGVVGHARDAWRLADGGRARVKNELIGSFKTLAEKTTATIKVAVVCPRSGGPVLWAAMAAHLTGLEVKVFSGRPLDLQGKDGALARRMADEGVIFASRPDAFKVVAEKADLVLAILSHKRMSPDLVRTERTAKRFVRWFPLGDTFTEG